ncbi:YggN family protein [Xanthomonas sp. NCPPB 2654]|uniref:YggN family protein n=1 Tax=unclassified Xanthomonas TaxID=2643310 RepID=UPI0021DFBC4E|nr:MULTISPECIES: YggN family protein [unclassified Xanthomonas]MDL5364246.1 YggN family protein [Xanthomonas sp. NCPPB 2654]UYC20455.1 YggN family protein [Xanthomonas sp. CFBP 8443]
MRLLPSVCTLCLLGAAASAAAGPQFSSQQCGFSTPYDVIVDRTGVMLTRSDGMPKTVFLHDGRLQVDGVAQALGNADAQRLRQMERGAQALMPEVAGIARETVGITFDAFGGVVEAITGSRSKARKLEVHRDAALAHLDRTLGRGRWQQELFDKAFEADVSAAAEEMASALTRGVMFAVFTGRADAIEKRTAAMEKDLERRMDARGKALEARADALCVQVAALDALEQQLDYRLPGGKRLDLLEHRDKPATSTAPDEATVAATGAPRSEAH